MSGFEFSIVTGAATASGVWYALENKLFVIPQDLLAALQAALNDGKALPNNQLAILAGIVSFVVMFVTSIMVGSCAGDPAAPAKKTKKKKKKKATKKDAASEAAAPGPSQAKAKKNKPKKKKAKQEKAEEEKKPLQKKKGGNNKAKKASAPAPEKKRKEKGPPTVSGGQGVWGLLQDSDSDNDDSYSAPVQQETASSKAAQRLRRQRQKESKAHAKDQQPHQSASSSPDEDGWTTHKVKRRARKTPAQKAAEEAALDQKSFVHVAGPNETSVEVQVPYQKYGLIIGPKGATLIKLQEATGTRIDVPKSDEGSGKPVIVTGPKEGCDRCKRAIKSLVKEGFSAITDPGKVSANITVMPQVMGIVIGPGGSNIKKIQEFLDVRVNTPDRGSESNKVTISGEKDAVFKAKAAIQSLVDDGFCGITHPGVVKDYLNFPQSEYHLLIGPGGQTIKSIKGDTGVSIDIPDPNEVEDRVVLIGTPANIARAKQQIGRLLDADYQAAKLAERNAKAGITTEKKDPFDW